MPWFGKFSQEKIYRRHVWIYIDKSNIVIQRFFYIRANIKQEIVFPSSVLTMISPLESKCLAQTHKFHLSVKVRETIEFCSYPRTQLSHWEDETNAECIPYFVVWWPWQIVLSGSLIESFVLLFFHRAMLEEDGTPILSQQLSVVVCTLIFYNNFFYFQAFR